MAQAASGCLGACGYRQLLSVFLAGAGAVNVPVIFLLCDGHGARVGGGGATAREHLALVLALALALAWSLESLDA